MLSVEVLSSSSATENRMPIIAMTTVHSLWVKAVYFEARSYLFCRTNFGSSTKRVQQRVQPVMNS